MRKVSGLIVCLCMVVLLSAGVQGAIVHRYAFDDPNDSVGGAHGVLVNNTGRAAFRNGQLVLGNDGAQFSANNDGLSDGDFMDLPNGIISALGNVASLEVWTTWIGPSTNDWQRIFDFGRSRGEEGYSTSDCSGQYYIFLTPRSNQPSLRFGYNPVDADERNVNGTVPPLGSEQHIVVVWNGPAGIVQMYVNGTLIDENELHMRLDQIQDINNWLGRAQWPDCMYNGSYNEFRIYDHAMSASEVAASFAAGTEVSPATAVYPANGDRDVPLVHTLEWAPGILPAGSSAPIFAVYFGSDKAAVEARSANVKYGEFPGTSLVQPAELTTDETYYWVVDKIVTLPGMSEPNVIAGGVVSFETPKTLPVLTAPFLPLYGVLGESVTLTVDIATASDVEACSWYKYVDGVTGVLLADGSKYVIDWSNERTTLTITDQTADDGGAYYCVVENSAGAKTSSNITLEVRKGLVHRYSFDGNADPDDPNVVDSVSGANGTLVIRSPELNTRYENGKLILGNAGQRSDSGQGDYVDLPNGIISALGDAATFEAWVTWNGPTWSTWQRIFDFGTSDGGEDVSNSGEDTYYVMLTPWGGANMLRTGYRKGTDQAPVGGAPDGTERWVDADNGPLMVGRQMHVAVVWDGPNHTVRLYKDGRLVGQDTGLHFALSALIDNNNWLGRAQFNDQLFRGSYDEFRIYDIPLTADVILAHYQAGPDVIGVNLPCTARPAADANGDCEVNLADLAIMADTWLVCGGPVCE
ncbi:MAG TPA: hypothetical protein P5279_13200 [Anaerohalosphaeraceae bacterium]|nr:hypothetical protein [Anaerohalosphaeraceae bacterium]HRT51446.1 hypothetical protein [Anaerohalosphaeraceae bacterium]HRT87483.1 hypothetical protein [Anaerohalosphaeraceae bacterium]